MKLEVFIKKPFSNFLVSVHPGLAVNSDDNSKHDYILFISVIKKKICLVNIITWFGIQQNIAETGQYFGPPL